MKKEKAVKIKIKKDRPKGYRVLGKEIKRTKKAILFDYYGWELWIPKSAIVQLSGPIYTCPLWAIDSAKGYVEDMPD